MQWPAVTAVACTPGSIVLFVLVFQNFGGLLCQSTTPDKKQTDTAASEHSGKNTLRKLSPAGSTSRPTSSAKRLSRMQSPKSSPSKRVPSSAAKRLWYSSSPGSENGNGNMLHDVTSLPSHVHDGLQPTSRASTTAMQHSQLRSPHQTVNGSSNCSDAGDLHNLSRSSTSEVNHRLPEVNNKLPSFAVSPTVTNKSPKVASRSPKVTNRSPVVNRSPRQRQSIGSSCIKRISLESPAGQPKTKKFIVERLRNAKTSRKKTADAAAGSKSSPSRKSPHQKCNGMSVFRSTPTS